MFWRLVNLLLDTQNFTPLSDHVLHVQMHDIRLHDLLQKELLYYLLLKRDYGSVINHVLSPQKFMKVRFITIDQV